MDRLPSISRLAFLSLLLLASSGCELFDSGRPNIRLSLPAAAFVRGEAVPLSIENRSNRSWYGTSICNTGLEGLVGGEWVPMIGQSCFGFSKAEEGGSTLGLSYAPTEIPPSEIVVMSWSLPLDLALGQHRIRLRLSSGSMGDGDHYEFFSPQFMVADVVGPQD